MIAKELILGHEQYEKLDNSNGLGCVQEVEGLFWRVRCNTKMKKQTSINLHGYFETLTQ